MDKSSEAPEVKFSEVSAEPTEPLNVAANEDSGNKSPEAMSLGVEDQPSGIEKDIPSTSSSSEDVSTVSDVSSATLSSIGSELPLPHFFEKHNLKRPKGFYGLFKGQILCPECQRALNLVRNSVGRKTLETYARVQVSKDPCPGNFEGHHFEQRCSHPVFNDQWMLKWINYYEPKETEPMPPMQQSSAPPNAAQHWWRHSGFRSEGPNQVYGQRSRVEESANQPSPIEEVMKNPSELSSSDLTEVSSISSVSSVSIGLSGDPPTSSLQAEEWPAVFRKESLRRPTEFYGLPQSEPMCPECRFAHNILPSVALKFRVMEEILAHLEKFPNPGEFNGTMYERRCSHPIFYDQKILKDINQNAHPVIVPVELYVTPPVDLPHLEQPSIFPECDQPANLEQNLPPTSSGLGQVSPVSSVSTASSSISLEGPIPNLFGSHNLQRPTTFYGLLKGQAMCPQCLQARSLLINPIVKDKVTYYVWQYLRQYPNPGSHEGRDYEKRCTHPIFFHPEIVREINFSEHARMIPVQSPDMKVTSAPPQMYVDPARISATPSLDSTQESCTSIESGDPKKGEDEPTEQIKQDDPSTEL